MQYRFTNNWFEINRKTFEKYLSPLAGRPIKAIEVGSYEGQAAVWFLENILIHPKSHIDCIDSFEGNEEHQTRKINMKKVEEHFDHNIKATGLKHKVTKHKAKSQEILRTFLLNSFDFIYIDASHKAKDVLEDGILAFRLLKKDGIISFDDYLALRKKGYSHRS